MALKLDFSTVETRSFEPVPEGTYLVQVDKVTEQTSKAGNPMFNLQLKIAEGEYEGRVIFDLLVITSKTLWRVQQVLTAFGIITEDQLEYDFEPTELYGLQCLAKVFIEQQEGYDDKNRVKQYIPM